jgi:hypothetical protein
MDFESNTWILSLTVLAAAWAIEKVLLKPEEIWIEIISKPSSIRGLYVSIKSCLVGVEVFGRVSFEFLRRV